MKQLSFLFLAVLYTSLSFAKPVQPAEPHFYKADDKHIVYVGRMQSKDAEKPKFWSPGAYMQAKFKGDFIEVSLNEQQLDGKTQNYLEIAVDNNKPYRIQTSGVLNKIKVDHLSAGVHTITICKDTESGMGYIEFLGISCDKLLQMPKKHRKIEFIGDSITAGTGSDESVIKCGQGQWYDQHNAYMSYGAITSRALNAQWYLTAVAGIGMIHSCCNMGVTMPQVIDKVNLRSNTTQWDFKNYRPDVVTICLGQNDGNQDSIAFCSAYVKFIDTLRSHYPKADIICLTSPMANEELTVLLKKYISGIEACMHANGDDHVSHYFFSRSFNDGCGGHPSMAQHQLIADELTGYIKGLKGW